MLKTYKDTFSQFNDIGIRYAVYKGVQHLNEDLNGERGDVDILFAPEDFIKIQNALRDNQIFKDTKSNGPHYFLGIDRETHKTVLLDMVDKIYAGSNGIFPYSKPVTLDFSSLPQNKADIKTTAVIDQIYTTVILNILKDTPENKDIDALIKLTQDDEGAAPKIWQNLKHILPQSIFDGLTSPENWEDVQRKYKADILKHFDTNRPPTLLQQV